ncbi:hypothetical protein [Solitalea lacus]|uniref:hypothetical protein n=1 Tax=Solitalea lacus TaxID=2911172 RepID=UPI001EDAC233|nr:hypothetical protein [Solitalea lacus]UKJ08852.1 hypothetical protein L2B55_06700 [Solitalea lacus]
MKYLKFILIVVAFLSLSCASAQISPKMESAEIKMNVISRGSYQYLIKIGEHLYLPKSLSDEYKEEGLKIEISYVVLSKKGIVYKTSPTDAPLPDFKVNYIDIKSIKKVEK